MICLNALCPRQRQSTLAGAEHLSCVRFSLKLAHFAASTESAVVVVVVVAVVVLGIVVLGIVVIIIAASLMAELRQLLESKVVISA